MKKVLISLFLLVAVIGLAFGQHTLVIGFLDSDNAEPAWGDLDWSVVRPAFPTQILTPETSLNTYWAPATDTGMGFPIIGIQIEDFNNLGNAWAAGQEVNVHIEKISDGDFLDFNFILTAGDPDIWDMTFNPLVMTPGIPQEVPLATTLVAPLDGATDVAVDSNLEWNVSANANGYKLYFGIENPPVNMVADDVALTFNPAVDFGKTYYWQVIPYNAVGDAVNCPVWSFTTATYVADVNGAEFTGDDIPEDLPAPTVDNTGDGSGATIPMTFDIQYTININGAVTVTITLNHSLTGNGILEHIGTGLVPGAVWDYFAGTVTFTWTFTPGKSTDTFVIGEDNFITPVTFAKELTATIATGGTSVNITWETATEISIANFNVYRADNASFDNAREIATEIAYNTAHAYKVIDNNDLYPDNTYYYWLETVDISGISVQSLPVSVELTTENYTPTARTIMSSAYPNPFTADNGTSIDVTVKDGDFADVTIYNILGQAVRTFKADRSRTINWDGTNENGKRCGSGIYFYRLTSSSNTLTKKVVIVK
jgi:hypothetical protein